MKMKFVVPLVVTSLALSVAACGSSPDTETAATQPAAQQSIRLLVLTSGLATALAGIADDANAYEREDVNVQTMPVKSGDSNIAVQQLLQGRADAAFVNAESVATLDSAYVAKGQPAPLKAVAATGNVSNVVLSKKIDYTGPNSLRGLTLGISAPTSIHRANLDYYLSTQGLSEKQLGLKFVSLGSSDMPTALASGQIDGFVHSEPTTTIALTKDNAQLALSMGGAVRKAAANLIAVRTDYLKSHGPLVKKLVAALQYATDRFHSMPQSDIVDVYAKYAGAPKPLMTAVYKQSDHYNPGLLPLRSAADAYWKVGIPAMKAQKQVTGDLAEDDMFDFTYSGG